MVECYLDEIIVEVQIFLGLYFRIIMYNSFFKKELIWRIIVTVNTIQIFNKKKKL